MDPKTHFLILAIVVIVIVVATLTILRGMQARRQAEVHQRLLNVDLGDLVARGEALPYIDLAEAVGLDWETILEENRRRHDERNEDRRKRLAERNKALLDAERAEHARQQAQEAEALTSIMSVMDDPEEIERFRREQERHGR